jgi:hypothetical protein
MHYNNPGPVAVELVLKQQQASHELAKSSAVAQHMQCMATCQCLAHAFATFATLGLSCAYLFMLLCSPTAELQPSARRSVKNNSATNVDSNPTALA